MKTQARRLIVWAALIGAAGFAGGCPGADPSISGGSGGSGAPPGSGGAAAPGSGGVPSGSGGAPSGSGGAPSGSGGAPSGSGGAPSGGAGVSGTGGITSVATGGTTATGTGGGSAGAAVATGGAGGSDPMGTGGGSATGGRSAGGRGGGTTPTGGIAGTSGSPGTGGNTGTGGNAGDLKATMVVRGAGTPTAGDMIMRGRLTAYGFQQIVIVSDAAVTAQSVADSDLVLISSSAESGPLQSKLRDVAKPVLCIEDAEFTFMGMAASGNHDAGVSQVVIVDGASALVGSATGTVTISSMAGELGWGTFPASAAVVKGATMPGNATRAAIFGYPKGAQMATMVAPARRAGFAIREVLAANLNANGIKLFDAILAWVMQ